MTELQVLPRYSEAGRDQIYDLLSGSGNMSLIRNTRRRSCELVNTPLPCVNKAIHHIGVLDKKIKEWFLKHECSEEKSDVNWITTLYNEDREASQDLSNLLIKGTALLDKDLEQASRVTAMKTDTEIVISEVVELIWRLEADRQEAEESFKLEEKKKQALIVKIDALSLWKLQHLPGSVQKEHESCAQDISELQWHIACKKQELENAQNKAAKTEAVNARLQEEIDFIKKHSPLLEDKLNIEGNAMNRIKQAQAEATILLNEALEVHKSAKLHFDEATSKANQERHVMKTELDDLRKKLQFAKDGLICSKNTWAECNSQVLCFEKQIADTNLLYNNLLKEKQQVVESEKAWNQQVTDLKYALDDQAMKNKNLTSICSNLFQEDNILISQTKSQLLDLENLLHKKLHEVRDLEYKNKTITLENEDLSNKIKESSKTKIRHEADIERMQTSIEKNREQIINTTKELSEVSWSHEISRKKLSDLEERIFKEETRLKSLADGLRKQILDEVRIIKTSQAKIASILIEKQKKEKEIEKVKEKLSLSVADIENPVAELEASVIKLRNVHSQKSKEHISLSQKRQETEEKFKAASQLLGHRKNTLQQQLSNTQIQLSQTSAELKQTTISIENLHNETRNLKQYEIIVENAMKSTKSAISLLQEDYNVLELKLNDIKNVSTYLENEIEALTQRLHEEEENNRIQLLLRQDILMQSKVGLKVSLNENATLAKEHQNLHTCYLDSKDKMMSEYEKRLRMEGTLRDYLQLSVLQRKMQRALVEYFKQRGLYSQAGLAKFQAASQENAQKILAVQEEMSKTIQHVSAFLTSLTDGSPNEDSKETNQSLKC